MRAPVGGVTIDGAAVPVVLRSTWPRLSVQAAAMPMGCPSAMAPQASETGGQEVRDDHTTDDAAGTEEPKAVMAPGLSAAPRPVRAEDPPRVVRVSGGVEGPWSRVHGLDLHLNDPIPAAPEDTAGLIDRRPD